MNVSNSTAFRCYLAFRNFWMMGQQPTRWRLFVVRRQINKSFPNSFPLFLFSISSALVTTHSVLTVSVLLFNSLLIHGLRMVMPPDKKLTCKSDNSSMCIHFE